MALYNEILAGRFNNAVKKFLSMKGGAPSPQLQSDIGFTFQFPLGQEFRALEGWRRYGGNFNSTGGVAQNAVARLRNPAGSNVIVVIEKAMVSALTATNVLWAFPPPGVFVDLTTVITINALDGRLGSAHPTCVYSMTTNGVNAGSNIAQVAIAANGAYDLIQDWIHEIVLAPGQVFDFFDNTTNHQILGTTFWRERPMEESELVI